MTAYPLLPQMGRRELLKCNFFKLFLFKKNIDKTNNFGGNLILINFKTMTIFIKDFFKKYKKIFRQKIQFCIK